MPLFLLVHVYSLLLFISLFSEWTHERWYWTTETAFSSFQVWQGNWMETRKQKESGPELATHQLNFQFSIKYSLKHDIPRRKKRCDRKKNLYWNRQCFPSHPQKLGSWQSGKHTKQGLFHVYFHEHSFIARVRVYHKLRQNKVQLANSAHFLQCLWSTKLHQDPFLLKLSLNSLKTYRCVLPNREITAAANQVMMGLSPVSISRTQDQYLNILHQADKESR